MTRPLRILLIEDNPDDVELVLRELRSSGFAPDMTRVETAGEMRDALGLPGWDAIISDYNLPTFNANAALGVLRDSGLDLPFIVVTGTIGEDRAVDLIRAGAHDFVLKDRLSRLAATLERAIGDARMRSDRLEGMRLLQATNHELATLVAASPLAIFVIGTDGRVRSWNPAAETLSGWPAAEVIGQALPVLDQESVAGFAAMQAQVLEGKTFTAIEMRWRHRTGGQAEISLSLAPLHQAGTGSGSVLGIASDVTDHKRLEHMLLQAQKMEAIGLLAGGVAHDFNNLLGIILGYSDHLLAGLPAEDKRRRSVENICQAAERASALTRQLLAFSRKQMMQPQVLDLNEVVSRMEVMLHRLIGEDIELSSRLATGLPPVMCDPNQTEQVLMNLAVNARDAMPSGGKLVIETSEAVIGRGHAALHSGIPPGAYVVLAVRDTGVGMDAATRERIFEPFFTTKERGRGTGLGLSTVFGIVKQSGGYIHIDSEPGRGANFSIYLPASPSAQVPVSVEPGATQALRGSETVLVVEDEESLRQLVCQQLQLNGYQVLSAADGDAGLDLCRRHAGEIHLLLTDIILPGRSGVLLAKELSAMRPALRVLYMSGYTDDTILRHGIRTADVAFIQKPFRMPALLGQIRKIIGAQPPA